MVRMSQKPVTSKISLISELAFFTTMVPCLFIIFWAMSKMRSPAEEM